MNVTLWEKHNIDIDRVAVQDEVARKQITNEWRWRRRRNRQKEYTQKIEKSCSLFATYIYHVMFFVDVVPECTNERLVIFDASPLSSDALSIKRATESEWTM